MNHSGGAAHARLCSPTRCRAPARSVSRWRPRGGWQLGAGLARDPNGKPCAEDQLGRPKRPSPLTRGRSVPGGAGPGSCRLREEESRAGAPGRRGQARAARWAAAYSTRSTFRSLARAGEADVADLNLIRPGPCEASKLYNRLSPERADRRATATPPAAAATTMQAAPNVVSMPSRSLPDGLPAFLEARSSVASAVGWQDGRRRAPAASLANRRGKL